MLNLHLQFAIGATPGVPPTVSFTSLQTFDLSLTHSKGKTASNDPQQAMPYEISQEGFTRRNYDETSFEDTRPWNEPAFVP